jgi:hypothetical protein
MFSTSKYDIFHLTASESLNALLSQNPPYRVGNIALSASIRSNNSGNTRIEIQAYFIGKRFEALYFQSFKVQILTPQ